MADTLLDSELRRTGYLYSYGSSLFNQYILPATQKLSRSQARIINETGVISELGRLDFNKLLSALLDDFNGEWSDMWEFVTTELQELTINEGEAVTSLYGDTYDAKFKLPAESTLVGYANNGVMILESGSSVRSGTWSELTRQNRGSTWQALKGVVRRGYRDGLTNQELINAIRGVRNPQSGNYNGGVLNGISRSSAETLARTGVNHYASSARDRWAASNKDILDSRILIATLDNRTTSLCAGRHLKEWSMEDDTYPRLPFHYNERSIYIYSVDGFDPLTGTRSSVQGQQGEEAEEAYNRRKESLDSYRARQAARKAEGESFTSTASKVKYRGRRDSDIFNAGQVNANMTFDEFLSRQPLWFVESQFGKARAKLIKSGKLKVEKLTDSKGNALTLDELRALSGTESAFRKAGL